MEPEISTENTKAFTQTLHASWGELSSSLMSQDFYVEIMMVVTAIVIAWGVAFLLRRNVRRQLEKHPPHKFDKMIILKPLVLLAPLIAFFDLSVAKPFALQYAGSDAWIDALMQLTLAYVAARAATLYVKSAMIGYFIAAVIMLIAFLDVSGFMASTREVLSSIAFTFGKFRLSMLGLAQGIIILVIVFWAANAMTSTLESHLRRSSRLNYNTRELIVKFFKIFVYCIAFLVTLSAMGIDLTALAIFGGALGVGIGLGLQRITANFVSGITLLIEKSIKIGDLIEIDNITGWVRQLNVRYTLIETRDGRELLIPNELLISSAVTNWTYTTDNARVEFNVGVSYDADVDLVNRLVMEAIHENKHVIKSPAPTCFLTQFGDSALVFNVTFWIANVRDGRKEPQSDAMVAILKKFRAHGVEIPFPQQVMHYKPEPAAQT